MPPSLSSMRSDVSSVLSRASSWPAIRKVGRALKIAVWLRLVSAMAKLLAIRQPRAALGQQAQLAFELFVQAFRRGGRRRGAGLLRGGRRRDFGGDFVERDGHGQAPKSMRACRSAVAPTSVPRLLPDRTMARPPG